MALFKRGGVWWYKFKRDGVVYRESTRQGNRRAALDIEAARKTELSKGEVGIKDRKPCLTLGELVDQRFIPAIEKSKKAVPRMVTFYKQRVAALKTFPRLWDAKLDAIKPDDITAYIGERQGLEMAVSTINRDLATLRRIFSLAREWAQNDSDLVIPASLPKIKLLPGETRRERVVSVEEEALYLAVASPMLKDFAVLEFDCGLRPEEAYRLKWSEIRNGNVEIHKGKTKAARRHIPASPRVMEMLMRRKSAAETEWVFPAPTSTGHANEDTFKKAHASAISAAGIERFVIYSLRHTCLTRWAASGMDTFTLQMLAGHADLSTTRRYVHMSGDHARKALERIWQAGGGTKKNDAAKSGKKNATSAKRVSA